MKNKTAFIGHRQIFFDRNTIEKRLQIAIEQRIADGCTCFMMGTHGEFDQMALSTCKKARITHPEIIIEVVLTSYHIIEKKSEFDYVPYQDVQTVVFDIEDVHFKQQITESNKKMIGQSDTLICYVDTKRSPSGAKTAMNYAKRKGLNIVNIFDEKDDPTFGMSKQESQEYWNKLFQNIKK